MKVATLFVFASIAITAVRAGSFSKEEQALWIDRHNYFRTTGLPWSAGDMRRIGWDNSLATRAASTASECSSTVDAGVNVYQSSSSNSSSILDEAIQQWVVETSVQTIKALPQPGANGEGVGTGVYNSYSQVVWASTTSVGCATASCSVGEMVVCEYSPAGNDGSSPWYVHDAQGSGCPVGTSSSSGVCVVEGDAANEQIAPIPADELTYQVYPTYVADIQSILLEAARSSAKGSTPSTGSSSTNSTAAAFNESSTAATPAPGTTTAAPSTKKGILTKAPENSSKKQDTSKQTVLSSSGSSTDSSSSSTKQSTAKTPSSSPGSSESSTKQTETKNSSESSSGSTKQNSQKTSSSSDDNAAPGKVKASSDEGSKFANQAASSSTESTTSQTSPTSKSTTAPSTGSGDTHSTTPASEPGKSAAVSALTESAHNAGGSTISAAGLAGLVVLAVVGVAAIGVVLSYRKNEKRQRDIMRDGGIVVI